MRDNLYKNNPEDVIWWVDNVENVGEFVFTFDREVFFNLFRDYPYALSEEQIKIFNRENPYWKDFFKDRLDR